MFSLRTRIPLLATAILLVAPAKATTTYYAGAAQETSFNTAVGGLTLLSPTINFSAYNGFVGTTLSNANGTGIDFLGFVFGNPWDLTVNSGKLTATDGDEIVRINFPAAPPVYAFGFHLTSTGTFPSVNWCIELTASACTFTVPNSSVQFFGVVSDAPITASLFVRHQAGSPIMVIPDFKAYGAATAVPEPYTMLLVGLGLVILPLTRWILPRRA